MAWSDTFLKVLKDNDVRLVAYVPDNVLTPLISGVHSDSYFMPVCATREDGRSAADPLAVKIDDKPVRFRRPRSDAIRISFMKGMGTSRGGALDG